MHRAQAALIHVGVDLGRRDAGVAEQFLDDAQVGAVREQVRGEGMAEEVRINVRIEAGEARVFLDELPDPGAGEFFPRVERKISAPVFGRTSFGRSAER